MPWMLHLVKTRNTERKTNWKHVISLEVYSESCTISQLVNVNLINEIDLFYRIKYINYQIKLLINMGISVLGIKY